MARKRSDIASRIVLAARRRFLQDGVDGASQREIARDAGTNLGMIYYYFPTKNDLFVAVADQIYARLLADVTRALADDVAPEERLRRLYARFAALSDDEFDVVRIVIREVLVSSERRHRILEMFLRGHVPLLLATLAQGIDSGAIREFEHPLMLVVFTIALGAMPQIVRRLALSESAALPALPSADDLARSALDVLMNGIRGSQPVRRAKKPARAARKPKR